MMKTGSQKVKRNRHEPDNLLRDPLKRNYRPTRTVFQSMAFVMETFFDALLTCSFLEDTSQWGECAIDNNKRRDLYATGSKRNHTLKLTSQSPKDNHSPMKFEPFTNPLFQSKMNNKTSKYTSPQSPNMRQYIQSMHEDDTFEVELIGDLLKHCSRNHWRTNPSVLHCCKVVAFPKTQHLKFKNSSVLHFRVGSVLAAPEGSPYSTIKVTYGSNESDSSATRTDAASVCIVHEPFLVQRTDAVTEWLDPDEMSDSSIRQTLSTKTIRKFWNKIKAVLESHSRSKELFHQLEPLYRGSSRPSFPESIVFLLAQPEFKVIWHQKSEEAVPSELLSKLFLHSLQQPQALK